MCVIIVRDPGIEIPSDKIESASIVNPDGWGIAIADRGKLHYNHGLKNDPEEIQKALEDAKDHRVLLHLRFITKGAKCIENCHPFQTLTHQANGLDIAFSHNGTLYKYSPKDKDTASDSWLFNEAFVKPALLRTAAFTGVEQALADPFLAGLLEEQAGVNSKFALIDGNGQSLIINHEEGKEFEGWWASNEYSFQRNHRAASSWSGYSGYSSNRYDGGAAYGTQEWDKEWQEYIEEQDNQAQNVVAIKKPEAEATVMPEQFEPTEEEREAEYELKEQCLMIGGVVEGCRNPKLNKKLIDHLLSRKAPSFTELCKINSLTELTRLDPEDISELITFYPEACTLLIQDLLYELYLKDSAQVRARAEDLAARKTIDAQTATAGAA